jgi:hypothetical protein
MFSIGIIVVPILVYSDQPITSTSLNLVGQVNENIKSVSKPFALSHVHVKPIHV